jgi:hypothetical protein
LFCSVAITAKEVYEKSLKSLGDGQLPKFGSCIMKYDVDVVNNDNINTIMNMLSLLKTERSSKKFLTKKGQKRMKKITAVLLVVAMGYHLMPMS